MTKGSKEVATTGNAKDVVTIKAAVRKAIDKMDAIAQKRGELGLESAAILANLENDYGLHRDAVRLALKLREMDEENRLVFDIAYAVVREFIDRPLQGSLFGPGVGINRLLELQKPGKEEPVGDTGEGEDPADGTAADQSGDPGISPARPLA